MRFPSEASMKFGRNSTTEKSAGNDRVRPIIKAWLAGLAEVPLTLGLGIVPPWFGHLHTVTRWTLDTIGLVAAPNSLTTFGVVDKCLYGYHGASIAYGACRNK